LVQDVWPVHGELHAPQLNWSVAGSTHVLLHHICVGVQRETHLPVWHSLSALHVCLHAPQLLSSLWRSTHAPLQML
jgi:hypothetical protein